MKQVNYLRAFLLSLLFFNGSVVSHCLADTLTNFQVQLGFSIVKLAGPPEIIFPMFATFDDRGRLFVAESSGLDLYAELNALTRKCRVKMLEDRDGDGRYETARVFVDQLVYPAVLVWRGSKLYDADPP